MTWNVDNYAIFNYLTVPAILATIKFLDFIRIPDVSLEQRAGGFL